jgi:hypothetical protein
MQLVKTTFHVTWLPIIKRFDLLLVIGLFLFSLAVRCYQIGEVPLDFMCDEADNYKDVMYILYGPGIPLFGHDWKPQPAFSVHLLAWWTQVVGLGMAKARLLSAILSALSAPLFYLVAGQLLRRPAALSATVLFITSPWSLNFSRSAWENIHIVLYTLGAIYAILRIQETDRWGWYAIVGICSSLGFLGYFSGQLILPMALLSVLVELVWAPSKWRKRICGLGITLTVFLFLCGIQSYNMFSDWKSYNRRTNKIALWNQKYPIGKSTNMWWKMEEQLKDVFLAFWLPRNKNLRYAPTDSPLVSPFAAPFLAVGLLGALFSYKKWIIVIISFIVPWILTQGLATGAPDAARGIGLLIPVFLFTGKGIDLFETHLRRFGQVAVICILGIYCCLTCYIDVRHYYAWQFSDKTINARYPAIPGFTFDAWLAILKYDFESRNSRSVNANDWQKNYGTYLVELSNLGLLPFDPERQVQRPPVTPDPKDGPNPRALGNKPLSAESPSTVELWYLSR